SEHALFEVPALIDRQQPQLAPLSALIASSVALDARERPSAAEHLARPLREFLKSEDSGDIARRLGARVRRARRRSRSSSPWLPGETGIGRDSPQTRSLNADTPAERDASGSGSAPVTRTFAAREDIEVWTRKLSSAPAPLLATPAATPHSRRLAAQEASSTEKDSSGEPSGISSSKLSRAPKGNAGFAILAASSAAFIAVAFAFGPHASGPRVLDLQHAPDAAPVLGTAIATKAAETPSAGPVLPALAQPVAVAASAKFSSQKTDETTHTRGPGPGKEPSADPDQFGILKITADPRAAFEVSGPHFHQFGQTPIVGLRVQAGKYVIVFRNDTFGTPVSAQLMVVAGGNRSVHADFRQAEPAVSVR
ncbi:MAG TPA: hypothetical protein VGF76_01285, partial [Polyangiaceae bacterium]